MSSASAISRMNSMIIYCDKCFITAQQSSTPQGFVVTSCSKIICKKCLPQLNCERCGPNCARKSILEPDVQPLFKDTGQEYQRLHRSDMFQTKRYKTLIAYQQKRMAHLENGFKQKSAQFTANYAKMKEAIQRLEADNKKLQKNQQYLQQRLNQKVANSPMNLSNRSLQNLSGKKSNSFVDQVLNNIPEGDETNASMISQDNNNNNNIYENLRAKTSSQPKSIRFDPNHRFQSTPLPGHENYANKDNFGFHNRPPSSIISRVANHRQKGSQFYS